MKIATVKSLKPKAGPEPFVFHLNLSDEQKSQTSDEVILNWMKKVASGELSINNKSLIIIDHSNAVSTRVMHSLLKVITSSNAKLVLFGFKHSRFNSALDFSTFGE